MGELESAPAHKGKALARYFYLRVLGNRSPRLVDALARDSHYDLLPTYREVVLKTKYSRDEDSAEMLDIIFASRVYDLGWIYDWAGVTSLLKNLKDKDTFFSDYAALKTAIDSAIADTVNIDKRTVAAILGVPPFVLGVGEYDKQAWNSFINNTIKPIATSIQQEMTKKLIISERMYLRFNVLSLMDWDIQTIYSVFGGLSDKGIVTGNEVRDRLGMSPLEGLDDLRILENYIPASMIGDQKKLIQEGD